MNAVVKNLVLNATKVNGLKVQEIMSYVIEQLTPTQYKEVEDFLNWCIKNNKKFGWGNIDERVQEFKDSL